MLQLADKFCGYRTGDLEFGLEKMEMEIISQAGRNL